MASIVSAGTTSATAMVHTADTSGVLQLASNNGTVALTIDTSQNVGIGTSSPGTTTDVRGANKTTSSQYGIANVYSTDSYAIDKGGSISFGGKYASDGSSQTFGSIAGRKESAGDGSWSGYLQFNTGTTLTERMRIDSSGRVNINSTSNLGGILQVNGNVAPTASASSYWGIDFGTSTSAGSYVTLAYGATYDFAPGAGCVWIYEQSSSVGLAIINCAYGGTYIVSNPQNNYSTTVNTASKTNVYYNAGTGTYRIQNLSSSPTTYSYWIATMRVRQGS